MQSVFKSIWKSIDIIMAVILTLYGCARFY